MSPTIRPPYRNKVQYEHQYVIRLLSCQNTTLQHAIVHTLILYSYFGHNYNILAVSTRPPAGRNHRASRSNSVGPCGPLSGVSRFALEFSRRLRASVRIFISTHQVAPATASLLLLMLLSAWFMVIRQMAQA